MNETEDVNQRRYAVKAHVCTLLLSRQRKLCYKMYSTGAVLFNLTDQFVSAGLWAMLDHISDGPYISTVFRNRNSNISQHNLRELYPGKGADCPST